MTRPRFIIVLLAVIAMFFLQLSIAISDREWTRLIIQVPLLTGIAIFAFRRYQLTPPPEKPEPRNEYFDRY